MKAQISDQAALLGAAKSMLNGVKSNNTNGGRVSKTRKSSSSSSSSPSSSSAAAASSTTPSKTGGGQHDPATTEEMQVYFSKLKELVPFMPRHRKLSKLEIIQYVIDYICDLQLALESPPLPPTINAATILRTAATPVRQPLGVIANVTSNGNVVNNVTSTTQSTTSILSTASSSGVSATATMTTTTATINGVNTCAAQEAHQQHDKLPSRRLDDLNTRPVSC